MTPARGAAIPMHRALLPLGIALAAAATLFPPALHPWSLAITEGLGALAIVAVMLARPGLPRGYLVAAYLLVPLAVASLALAPGQARAIDSAAAMLMLLCAGVLGCQLSRREHAARTLGAVIALLGTAAALQAVIQHHLLYPVQAALLRADPQVGADAFLVRLEAGRPSGPFILPAALGGFLALSIPLLVVLGLRARAPAMRAAAICGLLLQAYALLLARSFGGLLAVVAAAVLILPAFSRPARRLAAVGLVVALLAGSSLFVYSRRAEIGHAPGSDPISLRLGNWSVAAGMIGDHPLLGIGPGGFATAYPQYMREGMNQTRYAHCSYLQMAAEWGLWIILPLGALVAATLRSWRRLIPVDVSRLAFAAGGLAFLVHNLVDFTAYLPAIALPGALMIGMAIGPPGSTPTPTRGLSRAAAAYAAALLLAVALGAHAVVSGRAHALLEAARNAGEQGEVAAAVRLASRAAVVRPSDPDAWAFLSEVTLGHQMNDPARRAAGEAAAIRAVTLDPGSAIRHYTRALYHRAAGEDAAAYRETRRAHQLYPLKPLYRLQESFGPGAGR